MVFFDNMGLWALTPGMVFMWVIGLTLIYLAITRHFEPLLLLPIGFGIILTNMPLAYLMQPGEGLIWRFYHYGIEWEIIPPLIFLGLGALPCQDAADSNDDGKVNISDPVNSLNVLFLGIGVVPPPLPPEALQPCDRDPTPDVPPLGCNTYTSC